MDGWMEHAAIQRKNKFLAVVRKNNKLGAVCVVFGTGIQSLEIARHTTNNNAEW